jgi:hypothetical protein
MWPSGGSGGQLLYHGHEEKLTIWMLGGVENGLQWQKGI